MSAFPKWSNLEDDLLYKFYSKIHIDDLILKFNSRSKTAIQKRASVLGLTNFAANQQFTQRIYSVNPNFFDKPNIQNSYWAGFIAADGNLGKQGSIHISLANKDRILLYNFKKQVKYNGPIKEFKLENYIYNKISIWGMYQWHDKLNTNWNIPLNNKTINLIPPSINNQNMIYAYIIGLIDGDGSRFFVKNGYQNLSICGTLKIVEWINKELGNICQNYPKIRLNGISKINYKCVWAHYNTLKIISKLKELPIDWKLQRKWF